MITTYQKKVLNKDTGRYNKVTYYEVNKMINGKRIHKRGFPDKTSAAEYENWLDKHSNDSIDNSLTVGELYNSYYKHLVDSGTKLRVLQDIQIIWDKQLCDYFKNIKVSNLTTLKIKKWQDSLLSKKKSNGDAYKNSTLYGFQTLLKTILNYGFKNGYIDKVIPIVFVKKKFEKHEEMDFYTPEEFNQFISVIDHTVYHAFFTISYFCGLRKGETLGLKWSDINLENKELSINKSWDSRNHIMTSPKTKNSYRIIILPKRAVDALISLKEHYCINEHDDDKFVFGYFKPIAISGIDAANRKYSRIAGIKRIRVHDFRHSHVSALINQGFSPFDIAKRLGHTPEMVNNIYGHWFKENQTKMVDYLDTI